jgi:hypothetical protein
MANEIQAPYGLTGRTLYALVRSATAGTIWQTTTSTMVAYVTANLANYIIAVNEEGTASRYYLGDFPAAPAGSYSVAVYDRLGGSPAEGDTLVATGNIDWTGAAVVTPISIINLLAALVLTPTEREAIADALLDRIDSIEIGISPRGVFRAVGAACAGKSSDAETGFPIYRAMDDSKDRISAEIDVNKNRIAVTLDLT